MEKKITCDLRDRWIANLRSDEYMQGIVHLKQQDRYCCLGVLCVTAGVELTPDERLGGEILPPPEYRVSQDSSAPIVNGPAFGIPQEQIETLWRMNDGDLVIDGEDQEPRTFPEIAEWIQENVECE